LSGLKNGSIEAIAQDDSGATMAPRLSREMGQIDWTKPAVELHNLTRGLFPWPGTFCQFKGAPLKIRRTRAGKASDSANAGSIVAVGESVIVACGSDGTDRLELLEVQPPNRAPMKARDWANGAHIKPGESLQD
jgi:methionyl-tRNA formyltransferase